ncbi:MAG: MBOAT family O-acyltransferase [Ruminococcus sp.]
MLFNSYIFILAFFPIVLLGYFGLNHFRKYTAAKIFLIVASLYFYGYFNWWYLLIIVTSVVLNYSFSRVMLRERTARPLRRAVFLLALALNIGSLFYFKYYDFFIGNINALFQADFPLLHLLLPLGISFFTFQQLSYVIDSYKRDKNITEYNFFDYALFVTYFPQLIAGPIVTHDEMVPQFADVKKKRFNADNFAAGLYAFAFGLGKKAVVADSFGLLVNHAFSDVSSLGCVNAVLVMLAYTFQIYFDFSGYCDMATGIGRMMNIDITMNFNSPYKAVTIVDFWKRWHITLTRFFTRYIYIPLGGNRKGTARTYLNIMIVFLVSGIWHGANWTFIVWGVLHGAANVLTRILDKATGLFSTRQSKPVNVLSWLITFLFVNVTWVIFRADSLQNAWDFFMQFFRFTGFSQTAELMQTAYSPGFQIPGHIIPYFSLIMPVCLFVFAFAAGVLMKNTNQRLDGFRPSVPGALLTSCLLVWCIMSFAGVSTFLYWNF